MSIEAKFFYANALQVSTTATDMSIKFMRTGTETTAQLDARSTPQEEKPTIFEAMVIGMSPTCAKTLLPNLMQLIRIYEDKYDKIPLDTEAAKKWKEFIENAK